LGIPCTIHMDPINVGDPVSDALREQVSAAVKVIIESARTGKIGDGKIFVSTIDDAIRIRTGEVDESAV
ncbi:MAG: P-II family nitrogen regulator, partial [Verrucomicrobia bacterium]|nr:P-II family nitrogen regulator [Verrucomicrobiota bacterium]